MQAMFERMFEEFGTIDILVNNAGLQQDAPFEEMTLAQWNTVIDVNLTGQFLCCARGGPRVQAARRAPGRVLRRRQDHLHELGARGHPVGRARQLRRVEGRRDADDEEHRPGGRAATASASTASAPARSARRSTREAWDTPEAYAELMKLIPYKRIGEPDDIARAAVWLASDDADYITRRHPLRRWRHDLYPGFETGG